MGGSNFMKLVRFRKSSTESGEKKRAVSPCGDDVIGSRDVVADRDGRVVAQKNRASILNRLGSRFGIFDREYEMLGGVLVRDSHRLRQVLGDDDGATRLDRLCRDFLAVEHGQLAFHLILYSCDQPLHVGDENGLCEFIVLGL